MKRHLLITIMLIMACLGYAKDVKVLRVTTQPQMVCQNCENKIKKNLRFEKGVQEITTDLDNQIVTVVYDADKTNEEKLLEAFGKIKYQAQVVRDDNASTEAKTCNKAEGKCCKKEAKKCEKAEGQCKKAEGECCKKK